MKSLKHIRIGTFVSSIVILTALPLASSLAAQANFPGPGQTYPGSGQTYPGQPMPRSNHDPNPHPNENSGLNPSPEVLQRQVMGRNAERQRRLVEDTDKLFTLASQLKSDVEKTNKDILSVDVVKRAEEIEKLAKSVKERMKG